MPQCCLGLFVPAGICATDSLIKSLSPHEAIHLFVTDVGLREEKSPCRSNPDVTVPRQDENTSVTSCQTVSFPGCARVYSSSTTSSNSSTAVLAGGTVCCSDIQNQQPHVRCNMTPVSVSLVTTVTRDELHTRRVRINHGLHVELCNTDLQPAVAETHKLTVQVKEPAPGPRVSVLQ